MSGSGADRTGGRRRTRRRPCPMTRISTRRRRSIRRFPPTTSRGDINAGLARAHVTVDRTYTHPAPAQQPHGAARRHRRLGRRRAPDGLRTPPRGHRWTGTRSPRCWTCRRNGSGSSPGTWAAGSAPKGTTRPHAIRRRGRRARRRAAGQDRGDPAADVRTSPATGRRQSSGCGSERTADGRLTAISHDVVEQTSTDQGVRRADRRRRPGSCTRRPTVYTTHRLARLERAHAVVDARARRMPGHVRAGVGDGRTGSRRRD